MDALIEELRGARDDYRDGAKLMASERSLLAVMTFLGTHPVIEDEHLLVPLTALLEATNHAAHGGRPSLFQPPAKKGGRPLDPGEDVRHAVIAFCLELLIETKMPRIAAARFVAQEANKVGVKITTRAADRSRDEIESTPGKKRAFLVMLVRRAAQGPLPASLPEAKAEVGLVLRRFAAATRID